MKYHDLTHDLVTGVPQYPGQPKARFDVVNTVEADGNLMTDIRSWSHVGTHVDAPAHMIANGATVFTLPLQRWMGPAVVVRVATDKHVRVDGAQLEGVLVAGAGLLIATGHSRYWGAPEYYSRSPYLAVDAARRIRDSGVTFVGLDFGSPDLVGATDHPCHDVLLGSNIPIIENLAGVVGIDVPGVWFCAAPLRVGAGDGGPCRAFALAPESPDERLPLQPGSSMTRD